MQTIEAGIIGKVLDLVKAISQGLFNALDKLLDSGVKVEKQEQTDNGGVRFVLKVEGKKADMTVTPVEGRKGYCDVVITIPGKSPIKLNNLPEKDVEKEVLATLKEYFNLDAEMAPANSSKKVAVTLQKIETAAGFDIRLRKITANFAPTEALAVLDTCAADDDFCNAVTEAPISFLIVDDGSEELAIDTCEDSIFANINPYVELAKEAQRIVLKIDMAAVRFNKANLYTEQTAVDSIRYNIDDIKRMLMKKSYEQYNQIPDLCACCCDKCDGAEDGLTQDVSAVCAWAETFYDLCTAYSAGFDDGVFLTEFYNRLNCLHESIFYNKPTRDLVPPTVV